MTAALIGAAIVWAVASPTAAIVLGKVIAHRDQQVPAPTTAVKAGEASSRRRGAHLWLVP